MTQEFSALQLRCILVFDVKLVLKQLVGVVFELQGEERVGLRIGAAELGGGGVQAIGQVVTTAMRQGRVDYSFKLARYSASARSSSSLSLLPKAGIRASGLIDLGSRT